MRMKWISVLLTLCLCMAEVPYAAFAAEGEPEAPEMEQAVSLDLSDEMIQEDVFLSEARVGEAKVASVSSITAEQRKGAQDALVEAWDSFETSCDLTAYQIPRSEFQAFYLEAQYNNPRFFYVKGNYSYYHSKETDCITKVLITYIGDESEVKPMIASYEHALAIAVRGAKDSWSDMEKVLYINDYLACNCKYDKSHTKISAYNLLIDGTATCLGYALAFRAVAEEFGLSCEIVSSQELSHAWNLVAINDSYYHVDATWNDPSNDWIGRARHKYFLKSTDYFKSEEGHHQAEDWLITGGLSDTCASDTKYDNYFWNSVDTGFDYIDGNWYAFDGTDSINQYTCDGTDFTCEKDDIAIIDDIWDAYNAEGEHSVWSGKFVGTGSFHGDFYYSGKDAIYKLDVATCTSECIFKLTEEQKYFGYIFAMDVTKKGEVKYLLTDNPNLSGSVHVAKILDHKNAEVSNKREETCTTEGYSGDVYCRECGIWVSLGQVIPANGHSWDADYTVDKEATEQETGLESIHCKKCDARKDEMKIPKKTPSGSIEEGGDSKKDTTAHVTEGSLDKTNPVSPVVQSIAQADVTLSETRYSYDGTEKKPTVTIVKLGTETLKFGTDYTVSYQNNMNIGTASVIVTGIGNYTGFATKKFTISVKVGAVYTVESNKYKVTSSKTVAFSGLKSNRTKRVAIPKKVKIGGASFKVTSIAPKAFKGCTALKRVTVPKKVKSIGKRAFKGCKKLETITIKSTILKKVGKNAFKGIKPTAKIKVPSSKLNGYKKLLKNKGQGKKVRIVK